MDFGSTTCTLRVCRSTTELRGHITTRTHNDHEVSIGSRQSANGDYDLPFAGVVDEVHLVGRALTDAEGTPVRGRAALALLTPLLRDSSRVVRSPFSLDDSERYLPGTPYDYAF